MLTVFAACEKNVSDGSVEIVTVDLYVGSRLAATDAPLIDVGGHAVKLERTSGEIVPAPAPPVCQAENVPSNCVPVTLSEAHMPVAERGSVGMKPFSRPS